MKDKPGIKFIPQTVKPKKERKRRIISGEPIDFRGLRYAPVNRDGVIFVFGMINQELGFIIETVRDGYPHCQGKRCFDEKKNLWEQVEIVFEHKSSDLKEKDLNMDGCDIVICWSHDWPDCPAEVLELSSIIDYLTTS